MTALNFVKRIAVLTLCAALMLTLLPAPAHAASARSGMVLSVASTAFVKENGSLWMWGSNEHGELGGARAAGDTQLSGGAAGPYKAQSVPIKIMDGVIAVAQGEYDCFAIKTDHTLWGWGGSMEGELGIGNAAFGVYEPTKIMDDVVAVSTSTRTAGAIKSDGSLWMWGKNDCGQIGKNAAKVQTTPIKVMDDVAMVSCGFTTAAVKTDGSLWMWGENAYGQLGNGTKTDSSVPVKVMDDVAMANCCVRTTVAVKRDGSLWMWGAATSSMLGEITPNDTMTTPMFRYVHAIQTVPVKVMEDVAYASNCSGVTAAIKTDGSLWVWGANYFGALGFEDPKEQAVPVKVMDGAALVVPGSHMTVVKQDGSVWTCGSSGSSYGTGNGSTEKTYTYGKIADGAAITVRTLADAAKPASTPAPAPVPAPQPTPASAGTLSDVVSGSWYEPYVKELVSLGAIKGYENGTFRPDNSISAVEAAAVLLRAFPVDGALDQSKYASALAQAKAANGESYWGNDYIAKLYACGVANDDFSAASWGASAKRQEIALMAYQVYRASQKAAGTYRDEVFTTYAETPLLVGDYAEFAGSVYEPYILWLYSRGIVGGRNERGDYAPKDNITRAEVSKIFVTLLHGEQWKEDEVRGKLEALIAKGGMRLADGRDFAGKSRIRYDNDVAYDYCRALEKQIGIQIFYLPEWTPREAGPVQPEMLADVTPDAEYFDAVLTELKKMKAAYDLYPEGFLREMAQKKGSRKAEIILTPITFEGVQCYGEHVYDQSGNAQKVDQIYYTGVGDEQYYSHEMGHMVMSSAAILNGWNDTCSKWESLSTGSLSYISMNAMTSRPEDWADTWAYSWHQTDAVRSRCAADAGMLAKVRYMSELLDKNYSTVTASKLPWAELLG